ncbi:MAG: MFS transporter [Pelolinea sp.]|jgi:MFS family permease|nr:MFS transporter [Pelolinea sp.]
MNKNSQPSKPLWTTNFILLLLANALAFAPISITGVALSLYIVRRFNGNAVQVGLISSMMTLSTFLFRPFSGYLIDRLGRKWTLVVALLVSSVINFCLLLPIGLSGLGILRLFLGFPFSVFSTGLSTLTADLIPEERRSEGFSVSSIIGTVASQVIAPIVGLSLLGDANFNLVFLFSGILGILAVVVVLLMRFEDIKNPFLHFSMQALMEKRVLLLALIMCLIFIGWPGLLTYGPLYAQEIGFSSAIPFLIMFGLGLLFSRLLSDRFLNLCAPRKAGWLALTILLGGFALTGFVKTQPGLLGGGMLIGMGYGLSFATFPAMAVNLVEVNRRGACNATIIFGQDLGAFLGSYIFGWTAQSFGNYSSSYALVGLVMGLPMLVFLFFALPDYRKKYAKITLQ